MKIRKGLAALVLALSGTITLGAVYSKQTAFYAKKFFEPIETPIYDGKIGTDEVQLIDYVYFIDQHRTLKINKPDGRVIVYETGIMDNKNLQKVRVIQNGNTSEYTAGRSEQDRFLLAEAQTQFNTYLNEIAKDKYRTKLESIK